MVREERLNEVGERAERNAEERLLDLLMPAQPETTDSADRTREKLRERLRSGKLDDRMVEVDVKERGPTFEVSTASGMEEMDVSIERTMQGGLFRRASNQEARCGWAKAIEYLVRKKSGSWSMVDQVTRTAPRARRTQ